MSDPVETLARFARALRDEGVVVGSGQAVDFCRAAALVTPADLYWAGRTTLLSRRDDLPTYDRVFQSFFGRQVPARRAPRQRPARARPALVGTPTKPSPEGETRPLERSQASEIELLRRKSFARCTDEELQRLAALMAELRLAVPKRRTRRRRPAPAGVPDLRRTIRRSWRTGGEPVRREWRERARRPRRLVLLLDVSGSMSEYSRALLVFANAALQSDRRWQAYCFGTRLTPLTRELASADPNLALERAAEAVADWDGGTRIGETLKTFLVRHGHGGVARGAVVVLCSDGLEVGDPEVLAEQMQRLSRLAYRVIWVNPLKGDPAYEPIARGMQAALPHIDLLVSGHSLESLELLAARLARL